jgi:formylglycine-generating enzyme required for sulfatase activity
MKRYPFKFLDAYTRDDRDIFFGREEELEALYLMVFQTDLLLVQGASGTGKTSLILCGLASRFQPYEWLALFVRRGKDLNESLKKSLEDVGGASPERPSEGLDWLDEPANAAQAPLSPIAQQLKAVYQRHFKPVYLIFDQFEELYILGDREEQQAFIETVREILRIEQPVKIIFSIREEYLGYLYEFERKVPELLRKKLRVEPMNLEKVTSILKKVNQLPEGNVRLQAGEEDAIAEGIFEKLKGRENTRTIELPYLQVFLDKLYLQITGDQTRQADAVFSLAELKKTGDIGDVLRNFLDDQVLQTAAQLGVQPETIWKTLSPFVTLEGTKEPLSADNLHERLPDAAPAFIDQCLQAFVNSRILRFDEKDQRYEVAHDSLALRIHAKRDDDEIALLEVQRLIHSQAAMKLEKREFFTEKQLAFIEPFLDKFKPGPEALDWIAQSRTHGQSQKAEAERRQREELDKAQQQAEQEKQLRGKAEHNEQRARQRTRLAALISLIALVLALFAGWSYLRANRNAELANRSAKLADEKTYEANTALQKVEVEKAATEEQRKIAQQNLELAQQKKAEAEKNFKKAKAEEDRARVALLQVKKEQSATEEQRQIAEKNFRLAEEATEAAKQERDKATNALENLEKSNGEVARLILKNADREILNLHYEAALNIIHSAAKLQAAKQDIAKAYLEIAFWHGEAGNATRAVGILDTAAALVSNTVVTRLLQNLPADTLPARARLREAMQALDAAHFKFLFGSKYYPEMVAVPGGTFDMGCDSTVDKNCQEDETLHSQKVSSFTIAKHEITWWQYFLFWKATAHEYQSPGWGAEGNNPAVYVSWLDAVEYCNWVSRQLGKEEAISKDGSSNYTVNLRSGYRLPTEAEWEFAAKEGHPRALFTYSGSNDLDSTAWFWDNCMINGVKRTHPVGQKKANALGLYDMSGNVWEWCWDWKKEYLEKPEKDYKGPEGGSFRVVRGGSWYFNAEYCRTAFRFDYLPADRLNYLGFRPVFVP